MGGGKIERRRWNPRVEFLERLPLFFHPLRAAPFEDEPGADRNRPMALLNQRDVHFERRAYSRQRLVIQDFVARDADPLGELNPEIAVTRVLSAEQILALFFHHILEQHAPQFRNRTFLITEAEETVNVPKFMELIFRPALKLFLGKTAAQEQLAYRMRSWMPLL